MALACEDANSKLIEVVTVADVDVDEDRVGSRQGTSSQYQYCYLDLVI